MAVTFSRVLLPDGKPAIRVDGAPFSPAWFRVRLLDKHLVDGASGEPPELLVKVKAYQVDSVGVVVADGEGPIVRRLITAASLAAGTPAMMERRKSIVKEAVKKAARSLVDMGTVVQISREMVD